MYITAKKRRNQKDIRAYYLYVCESHRVDGVVKNKQEYFGSVHETALIDGDLEVIDKGREKNKFTEEEIQAVVDKLEEITHGLLKEVEKERVNTITMEE